MSFVLLDSCIFLSSCDWYMFIVFIDSDSVFVILVSCLLDVSM